MRRTKVFHEDDLLQPDSPDWKPASDANSHVISKWMIFEARAIHVSLIVGLLFHLKITTLLLQAVYCPDGVLSADKSITCYEGEHLPAAILAWFLLIFYAVLYPVLCLRTLKVGLSDRFLKVPLRNISRQMNTVEDRRAVMNKLVEDRRLEIMGFLFSNVKGRFWWYNCLQFVVNWTIAMSTVFLFDAEVPIPHLHPHIHTNKHINIHTNISTHTCIHFSSILTHIQTHTNTYTHIRTQSRTHSRTHANRCSSLVWL
jgi:hypothetical protein